VPLPVTVVILAPALPPGAGVLGTLLDDARTALADYEHLRQASAIIRDRISFRKAAREGCTVGELGERDTKAIGEIAAFYKEVFGG